MEKIFLGALFFMAIAVNGQDFGGSLGFHMGSSNSGIGLKGDYNYHMGRKDFLHSAIFFGYEEFEVEDLRVPYSLTSLQLGYTRNMWENFGKSLKISMLGGLMAGQELINNGNRKVGEDFTLKNKGKFIFGPYVGWEIDFLVGNDSSVVISGFEYIHVNSDVGKLSPYLSIGIRHFIY